MKKKIEEAIATIESEMKRIETFPNYCLYAQWQLLNAQRQALLYILVQFPEKKNKAL